ncbi:hypothetical protein [Roseimaritima ulvae]|nr:hypothetical protein [Roseimaritima ulvae]
MLAAFRSRPLAIPSAFCRSCLGTLVVLWLISGPGFAQSTQRDFEVRLAAAHQSRFSGRSLRDTLDILSQTTHVTYWLDRRVDSAQTVNVPAAGPTVEQAFSNIAAAAGLVSLPIDNLVLVGRADWVDRAGTLVLAAGSGAQPGDEGQAGAAVRATSSERPVAIRWPLLTTPDEALTEVAEALNVDVGSLRLPHDLWPAFSNTSIRATTLLTLIGCEFDRWLRLDDDGSLRADAFPEEVSIEKAYPAGLVAAAKGEILQIDAEALLTEQGNQTIVRSGGRVHRLLSVRKRLGRRPAGRPRPGPAVAVEDKRFTIHWQDAPAGAALRSLAQAGGWTLVMSSASGENAARLINLKAEETPLKELVNKVAEQVDLSASWDGDMLSIDVR